MNPVLPLFLACVMVGLTACKRTQADDTVASPPPAPDNHPAAPAAMPPPATPQPVASEGDDMPAVLAKLTRQLHHAMIGRRLTGDFDEFVRVCNLEVPPPPPGKKYAISKQWKVVLVDAK